jgi:hypothetical protein
LPTFIAAFSKLKRLELADTMLTGTIPPSYFTAWPLLETFILDGANVTGPLPDPHDCPLLRVYHVLHTPVTSGEYGQGATQLWLFAGKTKTKLPNLKSIGFGEQFLDIAILVASSGKSLGISWSLCDSFSFAITGKSKSIDHLGR